MLSPPRGDPHACQGGQRASGVAVGAVGPEATPVTELGMGMAPPTCGHFLTTESSGGAGLGVSSGAPAAGGWKLGTGLEWALAGGTGFVKAGAASQKPW